MSIRLTLRRKRGGNALIELTLSLTFMTALFLGTWQYGYSYYIYSELEEAVRAGARYASQQPYNSATATPTDSFLAAVQNIVVYGDPAGGSTPVAPGLTTANVSVTVTFTTIPTDMNVAITGYRMPTYFGNVTLNGKPTTSFPFVGIFGPP